MSNDELRRQQHADIRRELKRLTDTGEGWPTWILAGSVESLVDDAIEDWKRKQPDRLAWIIRAGIALTGEQQEAVAGIIEGTIKAHARHDNARKINLDQLEFIAFWFGRYEAERDARIENAEALADKAKLEPAEVIASARDRCRIRKDELADRFSMNREFLERKIRALRKSRLIFPMPELPDQFDG
jgi:hypothetical protein